MEECKCRCHVKPLLHSQACCEGQCKKCGKHFIDELEVHEAICKDYNPELMYQKIVHLEHLLLDVKKELSYHNRLLAKLDRLSSSLIRYT